VSRQRRVASGLLEAGRGLAVRVRGHLSSAPISGLFHQGKIVCDLGAASNQLGTRFQHLDLASSCEKVLYLLLDSFTVFVAKLYVAVFLLIDLHDGFLD
jgi:hypothetical protein